MLHIEVMNTIYCKKKSICIIVVQNSMEIVYEFSIIFNQQKKFEKRINMNKDKKRGEKINIQ